MYKNFIVFFMFFYSLSANANANIKIYNKELKDSLYNNLTYLSQDALNNPYLTGYRPLSGVNFDVLFDKALHNDDEFNKTFYSTKDYLLKNPCDENIYCDIKRYHLAGFLMGKFDMVEFWIKNSNMKSNFIIAANIETLAPNYIEGKLNNKFNYFLFQRLKNYSIKCADNIECLDDNSKDLDVFSRIISYCSIEAIFEGIKKQDEMNVKYSSCMGSFLSMDKVKKQILIQGYFEGYTKSLLKYNGV